MARWIKIAVYICILIWGFWGAIYAPLISSAPETNSPAYDEVVVIPVEGTIDPGTYSFVERSLDEARDRNAAVIVEFDTPGGYIDSAEDIGNSLLDYPGKVAAWVNRKAISAGAYLALCSDEIYMMPNSTIGDAKPVQLAGGAAGEKVVSYWDGEMRSAAERNQRDKEIATAMVRPEVSVEGLVGEGQLLTLTTGEALEVGYSEGTVDSLEGLLEKAGLEGAQLREEEKAPVDTLIGWVTSPYISTILLVLGLGGLVMEVATAGFGVAGLLSLVSFGLYFGSHILGGLAGYEVILLFAGGIILMLIEALMPGFGVFGGGGLLLTFASIVLAAASTEAGIVMLFVALVIAGVVLFFILRLMAKKGILRRFILDEAEKKESGYVAPVDQQHLEGKRGKTLTPLRPAGSALIEDKRIDVVSEGDFIGKDVEVIVVQVEGTRVVVREVKE